MKLELLVVLVTEVTMILMQSSDPYTVLGCDGSTVTLSCPDQSYISLIRANYGRFSISVCNQHARQDIKTDCASHQESSARISHMCNNHSSCHVLVSADILPAVCPDTPKYLEAQYQCISHSQEEERSSQYKLPELGGNISDVWSERDIVLDREAVEDAIKTVIREAHIPVTERTETVSVHSDDIENISVASSVNYIRAVRKTESIISEEREKDPTEANPHNLVNLPQIEKGDSDWYWTQEEVLIIILCSVLGVCIVTITAAVLLIKTHTVCLGRKPGDNLEMSGAGSSAESDCSVYTLSTNINSENFRNFQQRFHQFNPEVENPHIFDTNSLSDRGVCCGNITEEHQCTYKTTPDTPVGPFPHFPSAIPYLMPAHPCRGNLHINYNISYNPVTNTCPCQCSRQSSVLNTDFTTHTSKNRFVCDV